MSEKKYFPIILCLLLDTMCEMVDLAQGIIYLFISKSFAGARILMAWKWHM